MYYSAKLVAALLIIVCTASAQVTLTSRVNLVFASVEEGTTILTARDAFTERLSEFDRSSRMKTEKAVSPTQLRVFVASQVRPWTAAEIATISRIIAPLRARLDSMSLPLPDTTYIVKTTGNEEGNAAYTRGPAIVLPQTMIGDDPDALRAVIIHELFHVMTRNSPALRDRLYKTIGFFPSGEVLLPPSMRHRILTNPDAPVSEHAILVNLVGKPVWGVPILYSATESYDTRQKGEFFDYMVFKLLIVDLDTSGVTPVTRYNTDSPRIVDVSDVTGFFEQIGRNTGYIIHPEEILADNFAMLVDGYVAARSPEILAKMWAILRSK